MNLSPRGNSSLVRITQMIGNTHITARTPRNIWTALFVINLFLFAERIFPVIMIRTLLLLCMIYCYGM